ncbi:MAG: YcxB family protein [Bacilli bacterium]|nr:YcxB family protein [Bacilli bacterium]
MKDKQDKTLEANIIYDHVISRSEYRRKDHKRFYTFHTFFRSSTPLLVLALLGFMVFYAIRTTLRMQETDSFNTIIMVWTLTAATAMMVPFLMIGSVNSVIKKETPELRDGVDTIEANKVKIVRSNPALKAKVVISWYQVESICETKNYIFIYTGPKQGIFIVKKDITEGNVVTFRELAKKNMRKNKKGKVDYHYYFVSKKKPF